MSWAFSTHLCAGVSSFWDSGRLTSLFKTRRKLRSTSRGSRTLLAPLGNLGLIQLLKFASPRLQAQVQATPTYLHFMCVPSHKQSFVCFLHRRGEDIGSQVPCLVSSAWPFIYQPILMAGSTCQLMASIYGNAEERGEGGRVGGRVSNLPYSFPSLAWEVKR